MSKRMAGNFGGDEARYGGERMEEQGGPAPVKATAAQMAKRKIAAAKTRRPRSESPAVFGAEGANNTNQSQSFNSPAPASFNFGGNTNATPSFGASAQPQGTQTQTNGNSFFGQSTPSFGTSFGGSQQNGAAPTTFNFSQNQNNTPFSTMGQNAQSSTATTSSSIFGGFGQQSQAPAQNGTPAPSTNSQTPTGNIFSGFSAKPQESAKPLFSFSSTSTQPEQANGNGASTPSFSFGQQPSQTPQTTSGNIFGGFGQNKPAEAPVSSSSGSSTMFGTAPPTTQTSSSNMFGSMNASKQPEPEAPKTTGFSTNMFGGSVASATPSTSNIFGGFNKPAESATDTSTAPKTGPIFGAINSSSTSGSGSTSNIFGAKSTTTETAPSDGGSIFDNVRKVNKMPHDLFTAGQTNSTQPKPTNMFGGFSQSTQEKPEASAPAAETPKPAPSFSFGQTSKVQADPLPAFGQQAAAQTPKPASNMFGGFGSTAKPTASTSMFGSTSNEPATATKPSESRPQNMFGSVNGAPQSQSTDAAPKSLFDRIDPAKTQSLLDAQKSASDKQESTTHAHPAPLAKETVKEAPAASTSLFNFGSATPAAKAPSAAPSAATPATAFKPAASSNMFGSVAKPAAQAPVQAPAVAATPARFGTQTKSSPSETSTARLSAAQQESFKHLNRAFLAKVQRQALTSDWTACFSYYAAQAAIIHKKPAPDFSATSVAPTTNGPSATPSGNMFSSSAQPPATAPVPRQRFGADSSEATAAPPATEKRPKAAESAYPKLPENASSTSKLFAAALEKPKAAESAAPTSSVGGFKPSTTSLFANSSSSNAPSASSASAAPTFTGFKPASSTPSTSAAPAFTGFKPAASTASITTTPAPSFGGFKPTIQTSSGTSNFLSAFGQNAAKTEAEEREKRKLEDYDSEDETLEEWEKRDKEAQEAKRAKLAETAKAAKGFVLSATSSDKPSQPSAFKLFSTPNPSKVEPAAASNGVPATVGAKASTGTFSFLQNKTQDSAPSAPKTTGLFGAAPPTFSASTSADTSSSALKFNFGASTASSAVGSTTSAADATSTTGTAAAAADATSADDGEPSDEPPVEQSSDLSLLLPEERENQDVLFELPVERKSRTYAVETSKDGKKAPVSKGIGKPYLLRSKITGRARLLFKIENGKAVMNYDVVKGGKYAAAKKIVSGPFMDHIHSKEPKLTQFQMSFSSEELANDLLKELLEAAK